MSNKLFIVSAVTPSGQEHAGSSASHSPSGVQFPSSHFHWSCECVKSIVSNAAGCVNDP